MCTAISKRVQFTGINSRATPGSQLSASRIMLGLFIVSNVRILDQWILETGDQGGYPEDEEGLNNKSFKHRSNTQPQVLQIITGVFCSPLHIRIQRKDRSANLLII